MRNTNRDRRRRMGYASIVMWVWLSVLCFARLGVWLGTALLPLNFFFVAVVAPAVVGFVGGFFGLDLFSDQ